MVSLRDIMPSKAASWIIEGILALVIIMGSAFWSYHFWEDHNQAPTKYLSIAILTRTISPGDTLHGRITTDNRRNCPGRSKRFLSMLTQDGIEEAAYREEVDVLPKPIGEGVSTLFTMQTPSDLQPGTYLFRGVVRFDCDGKIYTAEIPAASFRVCARDDLHCRD